MRKIKLFLLGFLPLISCTAIQYFSIMLMLLASAFVSVCAGLSGVGSSYIYRLFFELPTTSDYQTMVMILYTVIGICFYSLWYYLRCEGDLLPHRRSIRLPLRLLSYLFLVPGLQFFSGFLCSIIDFFLPRLMDQYEELIELAGFSDAPTIILVVYSIILAPVCEELIFRGVTMRTFERVFRHFWLANLMQALLFGVFHGNWVQGIYTFVIGFIFGYICKLGGSIWDSILLHMLFNIWGTLLSPYLELLPETALVNALLLISIPISFLAGAFLFYKSDIRMIDRLSS